jgi:hypothetical protein
VPRRLTSPIKKIKENHLRNISFAFSLLLAVSFATLPCLAQSTESNFAVPDAAVSSVSSAQPAIPLPANASPAASAEGGGVLSRIGVGIHMGTLGPGADVGYRLSRKINIRGAVNYFSISENFNNNGVTYGGNIKLESGEAHLDYFLWRSLHVTPGVLISNGNLFAGTIDVPGGQSFTLNHDTYTSDSEDPLAGTGQLKFSKVAPSILFGIGDLVPRGKHHFSVRLEVGGAFRGTPTVGLNFTGSVCNSEGEACQSTANDAQFQTDQAAQVSKFNNDISVLKFYPVLQIGIGIRL